MKHHIFRKLEENGLFQVLKEKCYRQWWRINGVSFHYLTQKIPVVHSTSAVKEQLSTEMPAGKVVNN